MLKSHIPSMQSLRPLLRLARSQSLSLNPFPLRCSPLRSLHPDDSAHRLAASAPEPDLWSVYDPVAGRIVSTARDSNPAEEKSKISSSLHHDDSAHRLAASAPEPDLWSVYDPVAGRIVSTARDSNPAEEKSKIISSSGDEEVTEEKRSRPSWSPASKRRAGKGRASWVCESCGATPGQWWGTCPACQTMGSVKQFAEPEPFGRARVSTARSWLPRGPGESAPRSLAEVNRGRNQSEWRIPLPGHFGMEVARVLGGGLVPGSLVLVGGDPGVGKSTLLLQIAAIIAEGFGLKGPAPVVYVSGEESIEQIGDRADRMRITTSDLFLYSSTDIEDILDKIQTLSPQALIIDSIQTTYLRGVTGSAGNIMQVKECTSALLRFAKQTNIPVLLIGHVTKSGDIAGPRILEHIVDTVLYMEGERYSAYRLLRSVKNRFGSTDELGVFEMSESGLQAVSNPSEMFLTEQYPDSEILAGLAAAVTVDGSRTFVIEVQALCISGSSVARQSNGVKESRADMIISVLMKQVGLKLQDNAVFLNVVSGFKLTETAGDLAIAAAICSSFLEIPIPRDVAFIGEVGLGGELRAVPRMDKRVISVAKLGYKKCIVPKTTQRVLSALNMDITILGCRNMKEVIKVIFETS